MLIDAPEIKTSWHYLSCVELCSIVFELVISGLYRNISGSRTVAHSFPIPTHTTQYAVRTMQNAEQCSAAQGMVQPRAIDIYGSGAAYCDCECALRDLLGQVKVKVGNSQCR